MSRRGLIALLAVFFVTRLISVTFAGTPERYQFDGINPSSDVALYEGWARAMVVDDRAAYTEVPIEYPPGSLPFFLLPQVVADSYDYLPKFITVMLLLDIAGLIGALMLARRWGSMWGPWLWTILIPALGPVVYLRLDLIPAVATIWAVERSAARDWLSSGGWIGFGIASKLYPALFVLPGLLASRPRWWRFAAGIAALVIVPLFPLIPSFDAVRESVLGYHTSRGIQVESLWGSILFFVMKGGGDVSIIYNFGALHFAGETADALKPLATIAAAVTVLGASLLALRTTDERRDKNFAEVSFVVLAFALGFGSVFSPQFLVWLFALGACVACDRLTRLRLPVLLLLPVAILTHGLFPFLYNRMLAGETGPVALLWVRNLLIVAIAGLSVWGLLRRPRPVDELAEISDPSTPAIASG
ncbi:MAG: glycosyltransferase 87 family protein [Actinomycetota bacterium]